MDIQWKDVESTVQPAETDSQISTNGVYLRKDITQQTRSNNGITTNLWLYKEAFLSKEEHLQYIDEISNTAEYLEKQKQIKKSAINLEYVDKFNAFDIMWSRNVVLGKKTKAEYTTARLALVTELATKLAEV